MILRDAVLKANEKYFANATSDVDYMNAVMAYYKEYLFVMKMAMGGFQTELNNITRKYANSTSDTEVIKWAGEIRKLFDKKKRNKKRVIQRFRKAIHLHQRNHHSEKKFNLVGST